MKNSIRLMAALLLSAAAAVASAAYHVSAASTRVKGDINRDDIVSVGDMVVLKNHLLGRYGLTVKSGYTGLNLNDFVIFLRKNRS